MNILNIHKQASISRYSWYNSYIISFHVKIFGKERYDIFSDNEYFSDTYFKISDLLNIDKFTNIRVGEVHVGEVIPFLKKLKAVFSKDIADDLNKYHS